MEPGPICVHGVASPVALHAVCTGLLLQQDLHGPNLLRFSRRVQCGWGLEFCTHERMHLTVVLMPSQEVLCFHSSG